VISDYDGARPVWDVDQDRHSLYDFHNPGDNVFNVNGDDTTV
jgi:hypothetical protein